MSLTLLNAYQALRPHEADPDLGSFEVRLLSQGDSWFAIGDLPPWSTANILESLRFTRQVGMVQTAYSGSMLKDMFNPARSPEYVELLSDRFGVRWDALLVSGGGNDVIAALRDTAQPLIPAQGPRAPGAPVTSYIDAHRAQALRDSLEASLGQLIQLRDAGINQAVPILLHTYDYATPRPAPAGAPPVTLGPWQMPVFQAAGIPVADWTLLSHALTDLVATHYLTLAASMPNVHVVDTRQTLVPAHAGTTAVDGDWENEIHPDAIGYVKLGVRWLAALARLGIV